MVKVSASAIKRILKEVQSLHQQPPEDIQIILNEENLTEIQSWIRGPDGTPYEGGYFKVKLALDESFPDTPPKGHFITKIFHPNVSADGEICVNTLKKDWKPQLGIEHVLLTIKCLLIVPNPESALNEEAGKLLLEQYDDYARRAKLFTSIHAKSGKSEFLALSKERSNNQENQNEKPAATSNAEKHSTDTEVDPSKVLKPLSDNPSVKRPQEEEHTSKKKIKKVDKKKNLRRL